MIEANSKNILNFIKMTMTEITNSVAETEELACKIGKKLRGGEVIELISDLGGGKTTFVRGLVRGAGSQDHVSSPTFTISKMYRAEHLNITHFDFYRLREAGLMEHDLADSMNDETVTIVEWGESVAHVLPDERLRIRMSIVREDSRRIELELPEALDYLLGEAK